MSGSPSRRRRYDSDEEDEPPRRAPHHETVHRVVPRQERERSRSRDRFPRADNSRPYQRQNLISEPRQSNDLIGYRDDRYRDDWHAGRDNHGRQLNANREEVERRPPIGENNSSSRAQAPPKFATGSNNQPLGSSAPAPSAGGGSGGDAPVYTGPVEKPNFGLSGALAKDDRSGTAVQGVALKWTEPKDAAVPAQEGGKKWRLFIFKDGKAVEGPEGDLPVHRSSAYLFGRDTTVCDVPLAHPSISGQHAVLQHRRVPAKQEAGDMGPPKLVVKPYILDLGSTNGTFLNGSRIEAARFIELRAKDVLQFGSSTREYVLLHE